MKTLLRIESDVYWSQLWDSMQSEWFKVEVLQDYTGEDNGPSLDAWRVGDKERSIALLLEEPDEWSRVCQGKVIQAVGLTRIHVVDYPLSEYVQWEVAVYRARNIPLGGEQVYLVDRAELGAINLPAGDMMLFDQKNVVINSYNQTGYAYEQTFYGEGDDITPFLSLRSQLLKASLVKL
jgi:hypothetical protein